MAMMDVPLNAWLLFGHASRHFADTEVVTRRESGDVQHGDVQLGVIEDDPRGQIVAVGVHGH